MLRVLLCLCAVLLPIAAFGAPAIDEPVMLVAQPDVRGAIFEASILIVKPMPDGSHVGFIINRRTTAMMSELFPDDEASKKVADPLYLGGPDGYNRVFAMVDKRDTAGKDAMQMIPGVFLVSDAKEIGRASCREKCRSRWSPYH